MVRNVIGSLIALLGATAAVWSPFRPWYDGRHGSDFRIEDLFGHLTDNGASLFGSLFLPLAFAALLALIGVALRSRVLVALAGVIVLGFAVLWMVRQGQSAGELTAGTHGLGAGVAGALGGGALLLLGALVMRGRGSRVGGRRAAQPYDDGYGGYDDGYGRYDERPAPPPAARPVTPPAAPEPWDAGRPVTHDPAAQEWTPEQYAEEQYGNGGELPDEGPATRPLTRPGFGAEGGGHPPHEPSTEPWPRPTAPPPSPPPPSPPPTRPAHPQPPTPPVEWGKEERQRGTQQPPEERG
ncbi:hypothetical protein AB0D04_09570 [Streptomyces sp. NPDC048483]|uniref:hypothetical protein n=1 Tax=Streptomyces sp. NPDC048483 TaxID=3154927 RepID=UPI003429767E